MEYLFPQEIEVWYVIPLIRKELAAELKELGVKNTEIADRLGLTKAAVSQYLSGKRGSRIELDEDAKKKVKESAKKILKGEPMIAEINQIIAYFWKSGFICKLHKTFPGISNTCKLCTR